MQSTESSESIPLQPQIPLSEEDERIQQWLYELAYSGCQSMNVAKMHLDSFNQFLLDWMPSLLEKGTTLRVTRNGITYELRYVGFFTQGPSTDQGLLTPDMAREKNTTYGVSIHATKAIYTETKEDQVLKTQEFYNPYNPIFICDELPILVRSALCHLSKGHPIAIETEQFQDPGGYFILNGSECVVPALGTMIKNQLVIIKELKDPKYAYYAEIRSLHESNMHNSTKTLKVYITHDTMPGSGSWHMIAPRVDIKNMPFMGKQDLPIRLLFVALGWNLARVKAYVQQIAGADWDETMSEYTDRVWKSIPRRKRGEQGNDPLWCTDMRTARLVLAIRSGASKFEKEAARRQCSVETVQLEYARMVLLHGLLPHLGVFPEEYRKLQTDTPEVLENEWQDARGRYLCYILCRLFRTLMGKSKPDDRDHFCNRSLDTVGRLFSNMFRQHLENAQDQSEREFQRLIENGQPIYPDKIWVHNRLSMDIRRSILMGHLSGQKNPTRNGLTIQVDRANHIAFLSLLSRFTITQNKKNRNSSHRQLHSSSMGRASLAETSEGETCGLVWYLALCTRVSIGSDPNLLYEILKERCPLVDICETLPSTATRVFLNGRWIGCTFQPELWVQTVRELRRSQNIDGDTSVYWNAQNGDIHIRTDWGRIMQPMFRADCLAFLAELPPTTDKWSLWHLCERNGWLEYLDSMEEQSLHYAFDMQDFRNRHQRTQGEILTHVCPHAAFLFGTASSTNPFPHHNQAPRNCYQAHMGKQAMSSAYQGDRIHTNFHQLVHGHRALVQNQLAEHLGLHQISTGYNVLLGMIGWGRNTEDSGAINHGSIHRQMLQSISHRTLKDQQKITGTSNKSEKYERPNQETCMGMRFADYSQIGENGVPKIGTHLKPNQVVIGKTAPTYKYTTVMGKHIHEFLSQYKVDETLLSKNSSIMLPNTENKIRGRPSKKQLEELQQRKDELLLQQQTCLENNLGNIPNIIDIPEVKPGRKPNHTTMPSKREEMVRRDLSIILRKDQGGFVRRTISTTHGKTQKQIRKVVLCSVCSPEDGDKGCSRHAQKVTLTRVPEVDMPYLLRSGARLELLMNPHSIPGRMTVGHLLESIYGKMAAIKGIVMYGTPFAKNEPFENVQNFLKERGYSPDGCEPVVNGETGEIIEEPIFVGYILFERLHHLARRKLHARPSGGPVQILTRQPTDGRSRDGGLRFGEMEVWCVVAHGCPNVLDERIRIEADNFTVFVCTKCKHLACGNDKLCLYECKGCKRSDTVVRMELPYVTKLTTQELGGRGIDILFDVVVPNQLSFPDSTNSHELPENDPSLDVPYSITTVPPADFSFSVSDIPQDFSFGVTPSSDSDPLSLGSVQPSVSDTLNSTIALESTSGSPPCRKRRAEEMSRASKRYRSISSADDTTPAASSLPLDPVDPIIPTVSNVGTNHDAQSLTVHKSSSGRANANVRDTSFVSLDPESLEAPEFTGSSNESSPSRKRRVERDLSEASKRRRSDKDWTFKQKQKN